MSSKEKISEQLSAYLDGELSPEESRRMAEMVAGDPALSAELEALRSVQGLVRGLPPAQAPAGMADAVLARAQRRPAGWWAGRLARAAVILLVVGVGVTVTTWLSKSRRPVTELPSPSAVRTPILAKGTIAEMGDLAMAEVTNVFINTDNLVLTQRQVESVFGRNSIKPMVAKDTVRLTKDAPESRGRANFYSQTQVAPTQMRYEVVIEENQMRQIVSELNEIRARQNVAQIPMKHGIIKDGDAVALAKTDYRSRSAAGRVRRDPGYGKSMDKKRFGEKARLERSAGGVGIAKVTGRAEDAASQPAAAPKPAAPTTMPASTVVAQRKVEETREQKVAHRQAATQATANVRQLVVILNVVGE